jgi:hypothetical protein
MIEDVETAAPTMLRDRPRVVPPAFVEVEDVAIAVAPTSHAVPVASAPAEVPSAPGSASDRLALAERLEREALTRRFSELDKRSEALALEQQRAFAARLDAAVAAEVALLRERRSEAEARLAAWEAGERERITAGLQAEEQQFADRLMRQLHEFEEQLAAEGLAG